MSDMTLQNKDYRTEILAIIRENTDTGVLYQLWEEYHDNDIASVLPELSREERERLLAAIGYEKMSNIVSYLEDASDYLSDLDASAAADIIEQMDADEALEALEDLDSRTREAVLSQIEDTEIKEEIALLNSYEEDEFGSYMSTNFIAIPRNSTVKSAMRALVSQAAQNDNIHTIFVTDEGRFYGAIELTALIVARSEDALEDLICTTFPFVNDKDSIADNIERLRGYSEDLIPVLSERTARCWA